MQPIRFAPKDMGPVSLEIRPSHLAQSQFTGERLESLRKRVAELCTEVSPISNRQLIPENVLLSGILRLRPLSSPSFVEILPIEACNHACVWCFTANSRSTSTISSEFLRQSLQYLISGGTRSVLFSGGGEPLLFRPLTTKDPVFGGNTVAAWLAGEGVSTGLITNGVLLGKFLEMNEPTLKAMSFLRVSLDATDALQYSKLHGAKAVDFPAVLTFIRRAVSLRGNSPTPAIGISFVVNEKASLNCDPAALNEIDLLAKRLGVDFVQLKHVHCEDDLPADTTMMNVKSRAQEFSNAGYEWWIHRYMRPSAANVCRVPQVAQVIRSDGKRSPCCHLQHLPLPGATDFSTSLFNVYGCTSSVCRYVSLNNTLEAISTDQLANTRALESLVKSLERDGYHPYRLYPSAPDLA